MPDQDVLTMPLIERVTPHGCADDSWVMENLVRDYYDLVSSLAISILNDLDEADDAAQEAFIAASRPLDGYRGEASLKTWLVTIAVNVCRDHLRKRRARQVLRSALEAIHILAAMPPSPEETAIRSDEYRELWKAVDALGEKHRLPVILRYVHELTVPEIAGILGTSEGTVHSRLHYARRRLQARLGLSIIREEVADEAVSP